MVPTGSTWWVRESAQTHGRPSRPWSPRSVATPSCRPTCSCGSTTPGPPPGASSPGWSGWPRTTSAAVRPGSRSASSTQDLEVDAEVCRNLAERLPGVPWVFHEAIDATLDATPVLGPRHRPPRPGRRPVLGLAARPLDRVRRPAGPRHWPPHPWARLLIAGGGLVAEQVPWFLRAGVRQFHVSEQVRPEASPRAYVDAGLVRSWRLLLDDALARAERSAARMIVIDLPLAEGRGGLWSHLASDTSFDELHAFAREVGIPEPRFRPRPLRRTRGVVRRDGGRRRGPDQLPRAREAAGRGRAAAPQDRRLSLRLLCNAQLPALPRRCSSAGARVTARYIGSVARRRASFLKT